VGAGETIRHDAWADQELQELYLVINDADWFGRVAPFIDRSENAIRAKMSALRREAGIVPKHPGPSARSSSFLINQRAAQGSDQLRRAIEVLAA
jgi:hypothetical protein